jgi:hypothetical protein
VGLRVRGRRSLLVGTAMTPRYYTQLHHPCPTDRQHQERAQERSEQQTHAKRQRAFHHQKPHVHRLAVLQDEYQDGDQEDQADANHRPHHADPGWLDGVLFGVRRRRGLRFGAYRGARLTWFSLGPSRPARAHGRPRSPSGRVVTRFPSANQSDYELLTQHANSTSVRCAYIGLVAAYEGSNKGHPIRPYDGDGV